MKSTKYSSTNSQDSKKEILNERIAELFPSLSNAVKNSRATIEELAKLQSLNELTKAKGSEELRDSKFDSALVKIRNQLKKSGKKSNAAIWKDLTTADKNALLDKYEQQVETLQKPERRLLVDYKKGEIISAVKDKLEEVMNFARSDLGRVDEIKKQKESSNRAMYGNVLQPGLIDFKVEEKIKELTNIVSNSSVQKVSAIESRSNPESIGNLTSLQGSDLSFNQFQTHSNAPAAPFQDASDQTVETRIPILHTNEKVTNKLDINLNSPSLDPQLVMDELNKISEIQSELKRLTEEAKELASSKSENATIKKATAEELVKINAQILANREELNNIDSKYKFTSQDKEERVNISLTMKT